MSDFSFFLFEDFISDPSFFNYAKGLVPGDIKIWNDWMQTNPGNQETALEARDFIIHLIPNRRILPKRFIDNEWNHLLDNLDLDTRKIFTSGKPKNKIKPWQYAAAVALVISFLGVFFSKSIFNQDEPITEKVIVVPKGQIRNILLPDSTLVYLNSDSRLSYNTNFGEKIREVSLEGEAYFDLSLDPSKPFIVHTLENEIKVLGTAFNVKAYSDGNIHQISLERGKIMISHQNQESLVLSPNQTYLLLRNNSSTKAYKTENVDQYSSWTKGRIVLRNHRFSDIAKDLERAYNVVFDVQSEQILNNRYTGEFARSDSIRKILGIMSLTSHFDFEIEKDTIVIK